MYKKMYSNESENEVQQSQPMQQPRNYTQQQPVQRSSGPSTVREVEMEQPMAQTGIPYPLPPAQPPFQLQPQQPMFQPPSFQPMQPGQMGQAPISPPITGQGSRQAPAMETFRDFQDIAMLNQAIPVTADSIQYLNVFMRTQIGRRVKVSFLIGSNTYQDRAGVLLGVGVNYILINETDTDDITACDFYNIKFVTFYH